MPLVPQTLAQSHLLQKAFLSSLAFPFLEYLRLGHWNSTAHTPQFSARSGVHIPGLTPRHQEAGTQWLTGIPCPVLSPWNSESSGLRAVMITTGSPGGPAAGRKGSQLDLK